MKYITSDPHLGHSNVIRFASRPFSSIEEMDEVLLDNMFSPLRKGDELYVLGDLSWTIAGYDAIFERVKKGCNFHWILGNHDEKYYKQIAHKWNNKIASVQRLKEIKVCGNYTSLCHYPMLMWNKSHHNAWLIHGHAHNGKHGTDELQTRAEGKVLNANCEFHNFKPWTEDEIEEYMSKMPNNWDYIQR